VDVNLKEMDGIILKTINAFIHLSVLLNKVRWAKALSNSKYNAIRDKNYTGKWKK
jgi:hypothetical protein